MARRLLSVALVLLAVAASIIASRTHRQPAQPNEFIFLFPLELLAVLIGGRVALGYLAAHPNQARGMFGVGLYILIVAAAIGVALPTWLPSDDTILGSALLAGVLAAVGTGLVVESGATLAGWSTSGTHAVGIPSAVLALLLVAAGGMVAPLFTLRFPIVIPALVALAALTLAWRQLTLLMTPIGLAAVGAIATIAVLILRGPDDWASASTSVRLYSVPIVILALAVSLAILDVAPPVSPAKR